MTNRVVLIDCFPVNLAEFYNRLAECYPEEDFVYRTPSGRLRVNFIWRMLHRFPNGVLLDVGCNRGYLSSGYKMGRIVGVDIALPALRIAKSRYPDNLYIQGDMERLDFLRDSSVKNILCSESIEHIEDAEGVVRSFFRIIKPGGYLLITCPNYGRIKPQYLSDDIPESFGVASPEGYIHTAYRPSELAGMAAGAGFELLESGTFEKETRFWQAALSIIFERLWHNRSRYMRRALFRMMIISLNVFYSLIHLLQIDYLMRAFLRRGPRSYLLARKPE